MAQDNPLQALLSLVQGGQPMRAGMAATGPSDMASETPAIPAQLQQLLQGGSAALPMAPMGPPMPSPDAVNPMSRAIQNYTGARQQQPGGYADDALDVPQGTAPNDQADQRMPGQRNMGAYLNANDPGPVIGSEYGPANAGRDRIPGQQNMGAYLNGNKEGPGDPKYDQTKAELDDVSKRMGGNPEEDGNFPSQKEIDDLNAGKIDPVDFDKKWGKGAAAEMQDVGKGTKDDQDDDDDDADSGSYDSDPSAGRIDRRR